MPDNESKKGVSGDIPPRCATCGSYLAYREDDAMHGWYECANAMCGLDTRPFGIGRVGRALDLLRRGFNV